MTVSTSEILQLQRMDDAISMLRKVQAENYQKEWYKRILCGGWEREQDGKIMDPHWRVLGFHEAAKALFCPATVAGSKEACWSHIGYVGTNPHETFRCPRCGTVSPVFGKRHALTYRTLFLCGSNRSWKTLAGLNEFTTWVRGHRPWDGTLTAPKGSGRFFGIAAQTFSTSYVLTIIPYITNMLGDIVTSTIPGANRVISGWEINGTDIIKAMSYDQWTRAPKGDGSANPFEGSAWYAFFWDEPMPQGARVATIRGLSSGRQQGWGREIIAATPLHTPYLWEVYNRAANRGGDFMHTWVEEFNVHENPFMTPPEIEEMLSEFPPEEREAREWGRFMNLAGRVYDSFDDSVHVVMDEDFDPLLEYTTDKIVGGEPHKPDEPSDWPVVCVIDPHNSRPWAIGWYAISPDEEFFAVREYPDGRTDPWERCANKSKLGYDDYVNIIRRVEESLPGGPDRVMYRFMDPNFGRTGTTASRGVTVQRELHDTSIELGYELHFSTNVSDNRMAGEMAVRDRLDWDTTQPPSAINRPSLYISQSCRNHWWSINNLQHPETTDGWDTYERKKPTGPATDFTDLLRYLCVARVSYRSWKSHDPSGFRKANSARARRRQFR